MISTGVQHLIILAAPRQARDLAGALIGIVERLPNGFGLLTLLDLLPKTGGWV